MKIRTALVVACFLLSVLPLGGIVTYSYFSSRRALQSLYRSEAARLTSEMDQRLGNIRDVLQQRLMEVSALPNLANAENDNDTVLMDIGDMAPLVSSLEFQPTAPSMKDPMPAPSPAPRVPPPHTSAKEAPSPAPEPPDHPFIVRVPPPPQMPPRTLSEEQRAELRRISELGSELGSHWNDLNPGQRDVMQKAIGDAQKRFEEAMNLAQSQIGRTKSKAIREQVRRQVHEQVQRVIEDQRRMQETHARVDDEATLLFGKHFSAPLTHKGAVVGQIHALISTDEVLRRLLGSNDGERGEITFAVDRQGHLYTKSPADRAALDRAGISQRIATGKPLQDIENWVVALKQDPESALRVGAARPFGQDLQGLRTTAAKNFGYGMALLIVAMIGIIPVANHITRDVVLVTQGAERIAHGDLNTRLPVRSHNEVGQLATAFNRMAEDLSVQQQRIVQQEREAIEYQRKSVELEEARRFQLSMLPKEVPRHPRYDVAVFTQTAAEVGGDYYDFHVDGDGVMSVTIGDATGHGARAGTMVAVIKALFAGFTGDQSPAQFLREATAKVRRMELERMAMALQLARFNGDSVTIASAGMPPAYLHRRANGSLEEIAHAATPLGTLGAEYADIVTRLEPGDTLLFMSDGFPELMNAANQQLGYSAAADAFAAAAASVSADGVIETLAASVRTWHGDQPPDDDVTFVIVRAREGDRSSFA